MCSFTPINSKLKRWSCFRCALITTSAGKLLHSPFEPFIVDYLQTEKSLWHWSLAETVKLPAEVLLVFRSNFCSCFGLSATLAAAVSSRRALCWQTWRDGSSACECVFRHVVKFWNDTIFFFLFAVYAFFFYLNIFVFFRNTNSCENFPP